MATYVYELGDNLYINLTNRCTNDCTFCVRRHGDGVNGYNLRLKEDAKPEDVLAQLQGKDLSSYRYIVFCGFGEPTMNLSTLVAVAKYVKDKGGTTKLNTNGHGSKINGRNIVPDLEGLIDVVSISLNDSNPKDYHKVSISSFGEEGFSVMLDFIRDAVGHFPRVVASVVDVIPPDRVEACRKMVEELGAEFRLRHYVKNYG